MMPSAQRSTTRARTRLIYVPRSFYYNIDIRNPDREPARDELLVMRDRTERQIRTAVGWVVPETDSWKVDVDIIPDDVSHARLSVLPSADDARRRILDWGVVGTVGRRSRFWPPSARGFMSHAALRLLLSRA